MATVGERAGLVTTAGQVGTETEGSKERGRKRTGMEVRNADCYLTEMHLDFWTQIGYTLKLVRCGRLGTGGASSQRESSTWQR